MPLFVKPLTADASIGIDGESLVRDTTSLMKRVLMIHEKVKDSALVEEYIEGREFYVGVLGNREPVAFPPIEMDFSGLPEGIPHVARHQGQVDEEQRRVQGDEVGAGRHPGRAAGAAPEGRRSTPTAPCACATTAGWTCG